MTGDKKENRTLLVATKNSGKFNELETLLNLSPVKLISLRDIDQSVEVEEDGDTYEENASKKAVAFYELTGLPTLADDSGLEIDYLDGEPGILSSRYMGESTSYEEKNSKIIEMMMDSLPEERSARFKCALVLITESGTYSATGICEGKIAFEARGKGGFGYDPIFIPRGNDNTFGQLPPEVKNNISHRAIAARYLRERIIMHEIFGELD